MSTYKIVPISINHILSFAKAVDSVARERKFLAFLKAPPITMVEAFVQENIKDNWPHFIALIDDNVVGWCDITSLHRDALAHCGCLGIGVLAPFRGQGIGHALMNKALQKAQAQGLTRIELTVRTDNVPAIELYKQMGFVIEGEHRNAICIDSEYYNQYSMALLLDKNIK